MKHLIIKGNLLIAVDGVSFSKDRNKWRAKITLKHQMNLGQFDSEIEAAIAYNDAAISLFKEFAVLNRDNNGVPTEKFVIDKSQL